MMFSFFVLNRHGAARLGGVVRTQIGTTTHSFRPRQSSLLVNKGRRWTSIEAGDGKSGHIHCGPNEAIFFLDNIYPLKLRWLLKLPFLDVEKSISKTLRGFDGPRGAAIDPMKVVQRSLPKDLPIKIKEIIPRVKEGGSFVKFSHDAQMAPRDIEGTLRTFLKDNPVKPIFNPWRRVRAFLVEGKPWVEDLYRFPSPKVKVEFLPATSGGETTELSQEQLYSIFRRYGKISEITPQPTDSKVLPKYANVKFALNRYSVMAKNCMHGFVLLEADGGGKSGTLLRINYEQVAKAHWIRDWLSSHPRVVIPLLAALAATIAVAIFDPIRTFFIKVHVTHSYHLSDNAVYKWVTSQLSRASDILSFREHHADTGLNVIYDDRRGDIEQIKTWLMETADTFVVVQGPRGSGKRELVIDQALKGRNNTLIIDCKPIQEARGDGATIAATAKQVGYRPVFSWMNSVSSLVDLAAQGTIGTKTGFSETLDSQLDKIFQNTATALKQIALESRKNDDKDKDLGDDEYLDAHPERRPAVVIDNFLHKSSESNIVYDKISEWAATLTTANIAHVIFLTHDVSFSKSLSKALPDRVFRQLSLGDCSPEVAKRYVLRHLDADVQEGKGKGKDGSKDSKDENELASPSHTRDDLRQLDECIETLGGRLTDLEFLARRIKTGETPTKAVQEIIEQSASEILKMHLLDHSSRPWTTTQAWHLIKSLSASDTIRYNAVLLSDLFKTSDDTTLQALEQAELITIVSVNGRPHAIKPGKPVYAAAFKHLTRDHVLQSRLDLEVLTELIKVETQGIDKCEKELGLLGGLPKQPSELVGRVKWLLAKVEAGQRKVEGYERESAGLKKVLQREY